MEGAGGWRVRGQGSALSTYLVSFESGSPGCPLWAEGGEGPGPSNRTPSHPAWPSPPGSRVDRLHTGRTCGVGTSTHRRPWWSRRPRGTGGPLSPWGAGQALPESEREEQSDRGPPPTAPHYREPAGLAAPLPPPLHLLPAAPLPALRRGPADPSLPEGPSGRGSRRCRERRGGPRRPRPPGHREPRHECPGPPSLAPECPPPPPGDRQRLTFAPGGPLAPGGPCTPTPGSPFEGKGTG